MEEAVAIEPPIEPVPGNAPRTGRLLRRRVGAASGASVVAAFAIAVPAIMGHSGSPAIRPSSRPSQPGGMGGHGDRPLRLAFSPDGKILVTADTDGTARWWNVATQRQIGAPIKIRGGQVKDVAFSPNGKTVATADTDGTVRFWRTATHRQVGAPFRVARGQVLAVAFGPDGKMLATVGVGGQARLWDVTTRREIGVPITPRGGAVQEVEFSPNGKLLATIVGSSGAQLWNVATQRPIGKPFGGAGVIVVTFSPNGKLLASVGFALRLYSVATHQIIGRTMPTGITDSYGVAFTPDGKTIVTTETDGIIRQWSVATHRQIRPAIAPKDRPEFGVEALSPDGKTLATTQFAGDARLWNLSRAG